jgi:hypothetical protein
LAVVNGKMGGTGRMGNMVHGLTPRNLKDFRDLVLEIPKEFLRARIF